MSKLTYTLSTIICSLFIISCSKDGGIEKNLSGTYKFISLELHYVGSSLVEFGASKDKTVSYLDYISKNNTGTYQFNGSTLNISNIAYTVDTTFRTYYYDNNLLIDSVYMPYKVTLPPASGSRSKSFKITNDSIYIHTNRGDTVSVSGTNMQPDPLVGKVDFDGKMLYITYYFTHSNSRVEQGATIVTDSQQTTKFTFEKM